MYALELDTEMKICWFSDVMLPLYAQSHLNAIVGIWISNGIITFSIYSIASVGIHSFLCQFCDQSKGFVFVFVSFLRVCNVIGFAHHHIVCQKAQRTVFKYIIWCNSDDNRLRISRIFIGFKFTINSWLIMWNIVHTNVPGYPKLQRQVFKTKMKTKKLIHGKKILIEMSL